MKPLRNIVKKPVTGTDFFERPKVIKKIQRLLDADFSILISGPPKSGKTSFLFFFDTMYSCYVDVKAINKIDEYSITINQQLHNKSKVKFELLSLILIDNFSEMLENIYKNEGPEGTVRLLNLDLEFRKDLKNRNNKIKFIYTSSIDLDIIINKFNKGESLIDIYHYRIPPMLEEEVENFMQKLVRGMDFKLDSAQLHYLSHKIKWLYPFNIQMAFFELNIIHIEKDFAEITNSDIDEAIERLLKHKEYIRPRDIHHEDKKVIKKFKKIKLQRIQIQHVKCFEDIEITLAPSFNTTLIVGTNGKGKSTILQLIALGLSGIKSIPFPYNWKEVVKKNSSSGLFEIDILFEDTPIHLQFQIDGSDDSITCTEGSDHLESIRDTFMLLAYGVNRSYKLEDTRPFKDMEPIATLFGENGYLKHIKISANFEYIRQHFLIIQTLINNVLEKANEGGNVILNSYDPNGFYFITPTNPGKVIPMEALSEGFKSTLVWLFDAIIRIVENGGSLENASEITGIILLDEVDLHLHPSWQRTILKSIETLFPNIQFIVTTHSPFVAQSANIESLIVLEMENNSDNVIAVDKNITSNLSYNAIVREIFAIQFPFSREIELEMEEFRKMEDAIRDNKNVDMKKFQELVMAIAGKGVELEGIMRRKLMSLEMRTGKSFNLWKK